jgi:hypothetical protein
LVSAVAAKANEAGVVLPAPYQAPKFRSVDPDKRFVLDGPLLQVILEKLDDMNRNERMAWANVVSALPALDIAFTPTLGLPGEANLFVSSAYAARRRGETQAEWAGPRQPRHFRPAPEYVRQTRSRTSKKRPRGAEGARRRRRRPTLAKKRSRKPHRRSRKGRKRGVKKHRRTKAKRKLNPEPAR